MPLQKSFSEQNGSSRPRQYWNKARSHSAAISSTTTRTVPPKPLQPISEVTKTKLNAFKCSNPSKFDVQDANTPTISIEAPDDNTDTREKRDKQTPEESTLLSASKESSATPGHRIMWQDLIGTSEVREEEEEPSPNEKIGWDTRQDANQRVRLSPVMPGRRGKKRARSSSPVSSPASAKPRTPAVNVEKLSRALKSPHADPALELWDRFSLNGSASITPIGAMNSALAQIMVSSSPRSSRTPGESGLRRAISCGNHWPKRRRVERMEAMKPIEPTIEESPGSNSKSSMVNALLQTVNGEINKSNVIGTLSDSPRSPSPRKRPHPAAQSTGSPTRRKSPLKPPPSRFTEKSVPAVQNMRPNKLLDESSDYGDDDFDDDTLMELDASLGQSREEPLEDRVETPVDTGQDSNQQQFHNVAVYDDDDFDDVDDDIFTAAGDLITQIDSSHPPRDKAEPLPQPAVPVEEAPINIVDDDFADDGFGDDFGGDFDFEAAEIAATQSASFKTNGSLPPVRR
ncbi:hypothetical protein M426DRAFT_209509 [Hypoxylon sp. CI-4A]|nr:hypothetical protein M426DRAFT_209509 [Hypoxylon sp. CI-4A]